MEASVERIFNALGDSTRRAILERISLGPISVSNLAKPMQVSLAAVVQHVRVLEESGLVQTQKKGRVRTCRIEPAGLTLAEQWARDLRTSWERRFDRLEDLLAAEGED